MSMKFWQVDAFTDKPFTGNPAAVFILKEDFSDELKQKIAREMNLSETAFVTWGTQTSEIRWFTPNAEVNLCGHATLAAAHILWTQGFFAGEQLSFQSKSGPLSVMKKADAYYTLDFPTQPAEAKPDYESLIQEIIGQKPIYVGSNGEDCMAVVDRSEFVRQVCPNLEKIKELPERGFLLTAQDSQGEFDYIYKAFFPKLDVPEDPVTGSANTALAPYWAHVLKKNKLRAYQASQRGGELLLEIIPQRVLITGQAITIFEGNLYHANSISS